MDAFFVSVELLDAPQLIGKAVAVGGRGERSVISSASYEARRFGVRSAMSVTRARQLCPHLVILPPRFEEYRSASQRVMDIFREFTPLVEPLSIDEAFLDVLGSIKLFGEPRAIADQIRARVLAETGLPASVGLAANKFVAKLASQQAKPDGVLEIHPSRTIEYLHGLPVEAMWGVGQATSTKLHTRAIRTMGDLSREPLDALERLVGRAAALKLHDLAHGRDPREIETVRVEKSIGNEITFDTDIRALEHLERELLRLSEQVGRRLREHEVLARTIAVKLRWASFETVTRSRTLAEPTSVTRRMYLTAKELLTGLEPDGRPVRLLGVRAENLVREHEVSAGLWDEDERLRTLDHAVDEAQAKFGRATLRPARLIEQSEP